MESEEKHIDRNEIYYKNLPIWPRFDVFDNTIDGLIPSTQLESWEQFHEFVKQYATNGEVTEHVYRGQRHYTWILEPTLDRLTQGVVQEEVAEKQLHKFRLSIRGRVQDIASYHDKEEELWAMGQHHGLATPLLDWTMAPYVALFFAFLDDDPENRTGNDPKKTNFSRSIFVLNKTFIEDLVEHDTDDPRERGYPKIVEPSKDDHGRLVNQAGLFTMAPYGETIDSSLLNALSDSGVNIDDPQKVSKYICKIHIPNAKETRQECLRHLRKMNIHHASLFPDVIGASGYCNVLISEVIQNLKKPVRALPKEEVPVLSDPIPRKKEYQIRETDEVLRSLIKALLVDDRAKRLSEKTLRDLVKLTIAFIDKKSGVDWYVRDSELSRIRIYVRRQLKKTDFPEDLVTKAAQSLVLKVAEFGEMIDKVNRN